MTNVVPLSRQRLSRYPWAVVSVEADGSRMGSWRYRRRSLREALEHWRVLESNQSASFELWYDPHKTIVCLNDMLFGGMR